MLIDTHAHFYLKEFKDDLDDCVQRCKENGIQQVLMPNVDVESIECMHLLEDGNSKFFKSMMGIHPCYVKKEFQKIERRFGGKSGLRTADAFCRKLPGNCQ